MAIDSFTDFFDEFDQGSFDLSGAWKRGPALGEHDEIKRLGETAPMLSKRFTDQSFPSVTDDGVTDFAGYGESQSGLFPPVFRREHDQDIVRGDLARFEHFFEFRCFA